MTAAPVIDFRAPSALTVTLSAQAFTGTGHSGAIPVGTSSSVVQVVIYNNYAAASGIADANNCVFTTYDDAVHQGSQVSSPVTGLWVGIEVVNYNGSTTNADTFYSFVGGATKHALPTNSGTISGTGANYVTLNLMMTIPATATQGAISPALWIEFSASA